MAAVTILSRSRLLGVVLAVAAVAASLAGCAAGGGSSAPTSYAGGSWAWDGRPTPGFISTTFTGRDMN